jgi:uncharacterized membrane protein HdeD (DUF308 family)
MSDMAENVFGEARKNWGWLLALGVLFIALGIAGLGMTVALTITSLIFLGAFILVGGVFQLISAFTQKGAKSIIWSVLIALLYIATGWLIMQNPALASTVITAMIAAMLIVVGIFRIITAFQMKPVSGWGLVLLAGILSLVLGVLIYSNWPVAALWLIGFYIALEMLFHGISLVATALALRRLPV